MTKQPNNQSIARITYDLICKDFDLIRKDDQVLAEDELLLILQREVQHLLDTDFSRLLNILYRIDVPEQKVKNILSLSEPETLAQELSKLIIARQQQKAEIRERYRED